MPTFFLAEIQEISDETMYGEYIEKAVPVINKFGGEYIVKSNHLDPVSGVWGTKRIIIIKFASKRNVMQCFQSEEYRKIAHLREQSTVSKAIIIEESDK